MKIQVRKIVTEKRKGVDEFTQKPYEYQVSYENGFVDEMEIEPREITALSDNKQVRMIGIEKQGTFLLTLKSYKEVKKALQKVGMLSRFYFGKAK